MTWMIPTRSDSVDERASVLFSRRSGVWSMMFFVCFKGLNMKASGLVVGLAGVESCCFSGFVCFVCVSLCLWHCFSWFGYIVWFVCLLFGLYCIMFRFYLQTIR